eukprot:1605791-Prymnesium_polylepis.1
MAWRGLCAAHHHANSSTTRSTTGAHSDAEPTTRHVGHDEDLRRDIDAPATAALTVAVALAAAALDALVRLISSDPLVQRVQVGPEQPHGTLTRVRAVAQAEDAELLRRLGLERTVDDG